MIGGDWGAGAEGWKVKGGLTKRREGNLEKPTEGRGGNSQAKILYLQILI